MASRGAAWEDMAAMECAACKDERARRCRLLDPKDPRVKEDPFLCAPYIHQNNEPKYLAALLRAEELAKRNPAGVQRVQHISEP